MESQVTTNVHSAAGTGDETVSPRDPYPFFAHRRREAGVFRGTVMDYSKTPESLMPKREYSAVSFDAVNSVFRDGRAFKSKALARWEPTIVRPICNALIDEFIDTGEADLVRNFTFEFPTRVIAQLLGLPAEDLPMFRKRAVQLISYNVNYERAFEASAMLKDYFVNQIGQRKSKPTEDIIGDLVAAEIDGEKLSDEAIYSFLRLLLPAGLETTYRSSGNLLYLLLTHPGQFAAVQADRGLIAAAIEEGLRFETPLTTVQRFTTQDTELEGVKIPARSVIGVCIGSANRDERRWERSEEFDIFRKHMPHISFAAGEHTCLGLHLARLETRVALECLLNRLTNVTLLTDDDPHIHGQPFRSPNALPVTFGAK